MASPRSAAISRGRTPGNRDNAGPRSTTVGNTSGGQNAVIVLLDRFGSIGKAQAPSPGEGRVSGGLRPGDGGRLARNPSVVVLITRITPQEFPRKSRSIKPPQIGFPIGRSPVGSWPHHVAPTPHIRCPLPVSGNALLRYSANLLRASRDAVTASGSLGRNRGFREG